MAASKHSSDARRLAAYEKTLKTKKQSEKEDPSLSSRDGVNPAGPGLIKTSLPEGPADSKYRKVAKLLVIIGQEEAAKILSKLDLEQVELISREITTIQKIPETEAEQILAEFKSLFSSSFGNRSYSTGGIDTARDLLHTAFGAKQGEAYLRKAVPESIENPFTFLEDFTGEQLVLLLKDESASTCAMIISRLSSSLAASALKLLDGSRRLDIVRRIATLGKSPPEVLEKVSEALREKARNIGRIDSERVDGRSTLAAILRSSDPGFGDKLLLDLEEADPDLGRDLKARIHTLDDIILAQDRPIQEKLRTMSDKDIAMLLKGRSPEFIDKIKSNLSSSRRRLIEEERELIGPVLRRDAEEIASAFLVWFRHEREAGRILLESDEYV